MSEIVDAFAAIVHAEPRRPLIFLPEHQRTITAAELSESMARDADTLARAGLGRGDLIVAALGNRPSFVSIILACRALGVAVMALDGAGLPGQESPVATRIGAHAIVTPDAAEPLCGIVVQRRQAVDVVRYGEAAMLKLTSGSTSSPKAAITTEAQLTADSRQIVSGMGIRSDDVQLASIPLAHAYGFSVVAVPMLMQGTAIVLRDAFVPQRLAADVEQFRVTRFPGTPFMFDHLRQHMPPRTWPETLSRLVSAGAPLTPTVARAFYERLGRKIQVFYGTTETGGITFDDSDDPNVVATVGRPLPGVRLTLSDAAGLDAGRVHVRSDAVAAGYAGGGSGDFVDGGFLTGDYGVIDGSGRLVLTGRMSSFINVAGRKVQPAEVEEVLRSIDGIADVCVVAGLDEARGEHVLACVALGPAEVPPPTLFTIRQACARHLALHKLPREVLFVDAIPRNPRGKVDVDALHALMAARGVGARK